MHINIHINPEKNMQRLGVEVLCPIINVQVLKFSACYYAYLKTNLNSSHVYTKIY